MFYGVEIKVKIVNHIKLWKLEEGDSCIYILINLQDNSKMSCLMCLKLMRYKYNLLQVDVVNSAV